MEDLFLRIYSNLIDRVAGPLHFRLLLQPMMAAIFAIRDGINDAQEGRPAYLFAILTGSVRAKALIKDGWQAVARVFAIALIMDSVYQIIALRWVYPVETLIVAAVLAILPYLLLRGPVNLLARLWHRWPAPHSGR